MVNLTINGIPVSVPEGTTVLEAAESAGIHIPTLCYLKDKNEIGACRVCVVEIEGSEKLSAACNTAVSEGMAVHTDSERAFRARKKNVELILSRHRCNCPACPRSGSCQLQKVANDLNIIELPFDTELEPRVWDASAPLIRDNSKCIQCLRCISICDEVQGMHVWELNGTGARAKVKVRDGKTLSETSCTLCGQCISHCPVAALRERDDTGRVLDALHDPEKIAVIQIAPAVRVAWGEAFGMDDSTATAGRLVASLHRAGFRYVFDTDLTADLTIMEEGTEFLHEMGRGYPLFTSCCPAWVRFLIKEYPDMVPWLSSAKSPQQMFGAVIKSYFAEKLGVDPARIFVVSIMPCTAKKYECAVPEVSDSGAERDVDAVLTTREVTRLLKSQNVHPDELEDEPFDTPLGTGSGAGVIFGATGGVMEAALRTVYYCVTGRNPDPDAFRDVRGLDGWKEAVFDVDGRKVRIAVASGLANARKLVEAIRSGKAVYDFVEVMACPGGCSGGGGQPIADNRELAGPRGEGLYRIDREETLRFSHENPDVQTLYREYFGEPLSEKAHHLLHTDQTKWTLG